MAYITQQDLINLHLAGEASITPGGPVPASSGAIVWTLIEEDESSADHQKYIDGSNYFYIKNTEILNRKKQFYTSTGVIDDKVHSNHKIIHPFLTLLILQKIAVLLGKPLAYLYEKTELDEFFAKFETDTFHELLKKWTTSASYKGIDWLHVRPVSKTNNEGKVENKLEYLLIPAEQIIAIKDNRYENNLTDIIRYYTVDYYKDRDEIKKIYRAEWWNKDTVTFWEQMPDKQTMILKETKPHFQKKNDDKIDFQGGWGRPPFVELTNNPFKISDLDYIKTIVDDYDRNASDSSNDLEDMIKQLMVIRGYPGDMSNPAEQARAIENIRSNSAIFLNGDEGDGVDTLPITIQHEARDLHLQRTKKDIYHFGMGVDMTDDKFGNNPSGVALNFQYAPLFLKTDLLESSIRKSLKEVWWFENTFSKILTNKEYDLSDVKIQFTKNIITNESEQIKNVNDSAGLISEKTYAEEQPLIKDVEEELKRKEEERRAAQKRNDAIMNDPIK